MNLIKLKSNLFKFYFLFPALVFVFIFYISPNLTSMYFSLTDWSTYKAEINFIGFRNALEILNGNAIMEIAIRTLLYSFIFCILVNVSALILALILEKTNRVSSILRTIFFITVLVSNLAAGYLFKAIYYPSGPINSVLSFITGQDIQFQFLGGPSYTIYFVVLVHAWKAIGIPMLIYIAGLNLIQKDFIEAAISEGASNLGIIFKIKMPLLGPAFTFSIATTFIGAFSTFDLVYALTSGGPGRSTELLNMFIWRTFGSGRLAEATMGSVMLLIMIAIFAFPLILFLKRREVEL